MKHIKLIAAVAMTAVLASCINKSSEDKYSKLELRVVYLENRIVQLVNSIETATDNAEEAYSKAEEAQDNAEEAMSQINLL